MQGTIKLMGLPERSVEQVRATVGLRFEEVGKVLLPEPDISGAELAGVYRRIFPAMQKKYPAIPVEHFTECICSIA